MIYIVTQAPLIFVQTFQMNVEEYARRFRSSFHCVYRKLSSDFDIKRTEKSKEKREKEKDRVGRQRVRALVHEVMLTT